METPDVDSDEDEVIRRAQDVVLRVLEARFAGTLSPALEARIRRMKDRETLEALVVRLAFAASLAELDEA